MYTITLGHSTHNPPPPLPPTRNLQGPNLRNTKHRQTGPFIPSKHLRSNGSRLPPDAHLDLLLAHAVIHDPPLRPVRALHETGVADAVDACFRARLEHAVGRVLGPRVGRERVRTGQFEEAETVVDVVGSAAGVDDELLRGGGIGQLLGRFVRGEPDVDGSVVGCFLPWLVWSGNDGALGER